MKTKPLAIYLVIFSTIFTTVGQILWKMGAQNLAFDFSLLTNYNVFLGFVSYGLGAVILIIALRNGELSVLYPILGTSYIWVIISAYLIFGESITLLKIIGVGAIIAGVSFMGLGVKSNA